MEINLARIYAVPNTNIGATAVRHIPDGFRFSSKLLKDIGWNEDHLLAAIGCKEKLMYEVHDSGETIGYIVLSYTAMPKGYMLCAELAAGNDLLTLLEMFDYIAACSGSRYSACFVRPGLSRKYGKSLRNVGYKTVKHLYVKSFS